jgi:hypothetical protein
MAGLQRARPGGGPTILLSTLNRAAAGATYLLVPVFSGGLERMGWRSIACPESSYRGRSSRMLLPGSWRSSRARSCPQEALRILRAGLYNLLQRLERPAMMGDLLGRR